MPRSSPADAADLSDASAPSPPGLRERNKRGKERRIREAARALFLEKGYEAATLRDVAERADVGFGTVFAYAKDKSGLLAMVFVEELKTLPPLFPARSGAGEPIDELVDGLAHLYRFWASIPQLSGHMLRQLEFFEGNPHLDIILARRRQARDELAAWLTRLSETGRIAADTDIDAASETLFAVYTSAIREWSATRPQYLDDGLAKLRRLMTLPVRGLLV